MEIDHLPDQKDKNPPTRRYVYVRITPNPVNQISSPVFQHKIKQTDVTERISKIPRLSSPAKESHQISNQLSELKSDEIYNIIKVPKDGRYLAKVN
jgi:hypothetical protein